VLGLGSNVVELLLPQRRPMLMVDRIESFDAGPPPCLEASRHVSANEIFLEGHLDGLHLWPGCLTIEGMGQTSQLLGALLAIRSLVAADGDDPDSALESLRNVDLGFRLHPGHNPADAESFLARILTLGQVLVLGAAVDVKLLNPVFAGQRLDYRVALEIQVSGMARFRVEASVDDVTVARGRMTAALVRQPLPRPPR
jgi:3-hydroxyacyl-[acyl-carrier-protein] dehydratase